MIGCNDYFAKPRTSDRQPVILGGADDREGVFEVTTTAGDKFVFAASLEILLVRLASGRPSVAEPDQIVYIAPEQVVSVVEVPDKS